MTDILDLPGWEVIESRQEDGEYIITAKHTAQPEACTKCGVIGRLYRHGTRTIRHLDSPIRGLPVRLDAVVQRYRCRECGETFLQPLAGIDEGRRMTSRCSEYILTQGMRTPFTRVAEHVGCDEKTVRNVTWKSRGVFIPAVLHPPARLISKTEIGDTVLTLTPREDRMLAKMLAGVAMEYAAIEIGQEMTVAMAAMRNRVARLEARLRKIEPPAQMDLLDGV